MIDIAQLENEKMKTQLTGLRQAVIQADPMVIVDGRFEKMMTAPINVIEIARELLESFAHPVPGQMTQL